MMRHEEFERDWETTSYRCKRLRSSLHGYRRWPNAPFETRQNAVIPPERLIARQCRSAGFSNPFFLAAVLRGDSGGGNGP